jgi:hypothetical protein
MTSSTSASDAASRRRAWRRWLVVFGGVYFGLGALLFALLLLIDPYDTGRFPSFGLVGIADASMRTADASRGRDPRFNAAVIGNSTGQRLDPYRLSRGSGFRFIQLSIPQLGPEEQLVMLRWVMSHHKEYGALVIVTDPIWCSPDPNRPLDNPFPFWLYRGDLEYLANVVSSKALDRAAWRIEIALGLRQPVDPVGFTDYLRGGPRPEYETPPPVTPEALGEGPSGFGLPWVERLRAFLAGVPQSVRVVVVVPPVYYTALPPPGSPQAARIDACKAALRQTVADRPRGSFLDFRRDVEGAHDASDFVDLVHYRHKLAQRVEDAIVARLRAVDVAADARWTDPHPPRGARRPLPQAGEVIGAEDVPKRH